MLDWLKGLLDAMWVKVVAIVLWVISTAVLLIDGVTVGELNDVAKLIIGLGMALVLLIAGIKKLLQKKDTTNK